MADHDARLKLLKNSPLSFKRKKSRVMIKSAALKADPCIVGIISHDVPGDMVDWPEVTNSVRKFKEYIFWGNGTIIECENASGGVYFGTIIATAALFLRTNGVRPNEIEVDVYLLNGKVCKGEVFACDFHYNLAAIRIQSDCALQTATLRSLDDNFSLAWAQQSPSFQLRRHSDLFKVLPGTKLLSLSRCYPPSSALRFASGALCTDNLLSEFDCKELYWIKGAAGKGLNGVTIINCSGEVVGIAFGSCFLPSNIVSKWWNHYKSCRNFRRPWLGVGVTNLYATRLDFLEQFVKKFPNITTGVFVTKVEEDSPAYHSRIQRKDVIIKCDGHAVCSKLEFFDKIWDKAGKSVELSILRVSNGDQFKVSVIIGETPKKFHRWPLPNGWREDYEES